MLIPPHALTFHLGFIADIQLKFPKFILEINFGFVLVTDTLYLYRKVTRNNPKLVCKSNFGRKSCNILFAFWSLFLLLFFLLWKQLHQWIYLDQSSSKYLSQNNFLAFIWLDVKIIVAIFGFIWILFHL